MTPSPVQDRAIKFTVRLNEKEAEAFRQNAEDANMSRSNYMRAALTNRKIAVTKVPETNELMAGLLSGLIVEIRRLGNNVNQIAKAVNMTALGINFDGAPDARTLKDLNLTISSSIRDISKIQDDLMGRRKRKKGRMRG